MFDYKSIVSDLELTTFFVEGDPGCYNAFDVATGNHIGAIVPTAPDSVTFKALNDDEKVFMQFKLWFTRPERAVGKPVVIEGKSIDELIDQYEEILIGTFIMNRGGSSWEQIRQGYTYMIDWLRSTDFYTSPASTKYHESTTGGLLVHSLKVYNQIIELIKLPQFSSVTTTSAAMVALVHDWCKIGLYEPYMKNVKNDATGQWEAVKAFKRNQKGIPLGHGVSSMFLASKFFRLSPDEALAIRWHMSTWNVSKNEVDELQMANEKYPLVHLIQFADQLSITEYASKSI